MSRSATNLYRLVPGLLLALKTSSLGWRWIRNRFWEGSAADGYRRSGSSHTSSRGPWRSSISSTYSDQDVYAPNLSDLDRLGHPQESL